MKNDFLQDLRDYLSSTSPEDFLNKWSESEIETDFKIVVKDYVDNNYSYSFKVSPPIMYDEVLLNEFENLKETSGFCFFKIFA
jgi:hypothetical protein